MYRPIRVFVFHHVSAERDILVCQKEDWTQLDQFKHNIGELQKKYHFISLSEADDKLQQDRFRWKNYAVLTTDDGLASVLNVIPWLEEKQIPLTLFVNSRYMNGNILKPIHEKWLREFAPDADTKTIAQKMYLSEKQIWALNSPLIEVGMHGHEHEDVWKMDDDDFKTDVQTCMSKLHGHPRYIPAYAYPWGHSTAESLSYLRQNEIIPVVVRGGENYTWNGIIDRKCIDNEKF